MARPTLYHPTYCGLLESYIRNSDQPTVKGAGEYLECNWRSFYYWAKVHPEFRRSLLLLQSHILMAKYEDEFDSETPPPPSEDEVVDSDDSLGV